MKLISFIVILFIGLAFQNVHAQRGYAKDSLQIKVYTEIVYKDAKVESVKVTKVFCDYCDKLQVEALKNEAWNRSYFDRYNAKNKLQNGKRKLALYIRIAKADFVKIKKESGNNLPKK